MRLSLLLLAFCWLILGSTIVSQDKKAVSTLSLRLECPNNSIRPGSAPVLRLTIENTGQADERILKPRGDLQDTYYDVVITSEGKELSLTRMISDPGPIGDADFATLKPGKKTTFDFTICRDL
jgi:hypothetical protein